MLAILAALTEAKMSGSIGLWYNGMSDLFAQHGFVSIDTVIFGTFIPSFFIQSLTHTQVSDGGVYIKFFTDTSGVKYAMVTPTHHISVLE